MDDVDLLAGVVSKTGDLVEGVGTDQLSLATPCADYDVAALLNHMVGWLLVFGASSHDRPYDGDATRYVCGADPAGEFRAAAADLVAGWQKYGLDRTVKFQGPMELPGSMVFGMAVMEYLAHGWDLAVATGQAIPFTDREATAALTVAEATLLPEYRGEGMSFGPIVAVDEHAPAVDRFIAFLGRDPGAHRAP